METILTLALVYIGFRYGVLPLVVTLVRADDKDTDLTEEQKAVIHAKAKADHAEWMANMRAESRAKAKAEAARRFGNN